MRPLTTAITITLWFAVALGTCAALRKADSQDKPRAHCTAPDGSKFTLPPLKKRSLVAGYTVEYIPVREQIAYCSDFDCFIVPNGTTVWITGGMTGATLETRCE